MGMKSQRVGFSTEITALSNEARFRAKHIKLPLWVDLSPRQKTD
jgi:hypothetical protein